MYTIQKTNLGLGGFGVKTPLVNQWPSLYTNRGVETKRFFLLKLDSFACNYSTSKSVKCVAGLIIVNVLEKLTHKMVAQTRLQNAHVCTCMVRCNRISELLHQTKEPFSEGNQPIKPVTQPESLLCSTYFIDGKFSLKSTTTTLVERNLHGVVYVTDLVAAHLILDVQTHHLTKGNMGRN